MPIAAFYENIRTGALEKGISMTEAVSRLRESGMDREKSGRVSGARGCGRET